MKNFNASLLSNGTKPIKDLPEDLHGKSIYINENLHILHLYQQDFEKVSLSALCPGHLKLALFFDPTRDSPDSVRLHVLQHTDNNLVSQPGTNLIILSVSHQLLRLLIPLKNNAPILSHECFRLDLNSRKRSSILMMLVDLASLISVRTADASQLLYLTEKSLRLITFAFENTCPLSIDHSLSDLDKIFEIYDNTPAAIRSGYGLPDLKNAASHCGMCVTKFQRLFQTSFKLNYNEYCIEEKLNYAFTLLYYEKKQVKCAAAMAGYTNSPFFIRRFKKKFGLAPHELLKRETTAPESSVF